MKWITRLIAVIVISCAFAFLLSRIAFLQIEAMNAPTVPTGHSVFQNEEQMILNDRNLVDIMIQLPLGLRISKVDLTHSILSVDLLLESGTEKQLVYSDLFAITDFSFRNTTNIGQVFVRVKLRNEDGGERERKRAKDVLLTAMDAKRDQFQGAPSLNEKWSPLLKEQFIQSHFQLTLTKEWNELRTN